MPNTSEQTPTSTCQNCNLKQNGFLCHLTPAAASEFESIKLSSHYLAGSILFMENEPARGVFLVCSGKVKLSVSSKGGKTLILQMAKPGEVIGLSASMSGVSLRGHRRSSLSFPGRVHLQRRFPALRSPLPGGIRSRHPSAEFAVWARL